METIETPEIDEQKAATCGECGGRGDHGDYPDGHTCSACGGLDGQKAPAPDETETPAAEAYVDSLPKSRRAELIVVSPGLRNAAEHWWTDPATRVRVKCVELEKGRCKLIGDKRDIKFLTRVLALINDEIDGTVKLEAEYERWENGDGPIGRKLSAMWMRREKQAKLRMSAA